MIESNAPPPRRVKKKRGRRKGRKRDFITLEERQDSGIWLLKGKGGILEDDYEKGALLGEGAFAKVYKGKHKKTGREVAIKVIDKTNVGNEVSSLVAEVEILKKVNHQYVIKLEDLYESKENLYIVTELASGGELFHRILDQGAYTERDAAKLTKRILEGLQYLHSQGIVHRDLKPENLLLSGTEDDFDIRIADFGLSKIIGNTTLIQSLAGSPNYVAPEVLDGLGYREWADMWSVGVITYILLCGYPPFACEDTRDLLQMIQTASYEYDEEYWDDISDEAKNFVDGLLNLDHNARLTAADALRHPWLVNEPSKPAPTLEITRELTATIAEWKAHLSGGELGAASSSAASSSSDPHQAPTPSSSSTAAHSTASSSKGAADTCLEMAAPPSKLPFSPSAVSSVQIMRVKPSVSFYLFLYTEIGGGWSWNERNQLSSDQLRQIITDADVEVYVLYLDGNPAGFAEVDFRGSTQADHNAQLKHLGVFPDYIGRGLGSLLLRFVLNTVWSHSPSVSRLWLSISPNDHPNTLDFCEQHGFKQL